jgi:D-lactate dehydrogenase
VVEHPHNASALLLFPDIETACKATVLLKQQPVAAVELMDRAALRSVEEKEGMPDAIKGLGEGVTALLVETRAETRAMLDGQVAAITNSVGPLSQVVPTHFTPDPVEFTRLWAIRKGLFPAVGAVRETGTTVIIEDVAFPIDALASATLALQELFKKYHYDEAIIFGHALEGNLHFVFTQAFEEQAEIDRYQKFMDDVATMVVGTYDGSLKAEHGTGRNMAPYVEMEWGKEAYRLMKEIKVLFDPDGILNPGVILNADPLAHIKNLKPMPAADEIVDKCNECGFFEPVCPSRNLTFTPRHRITG